MAQANTSTGKNGRRWAGGLVVTLLSLALLLNLAPGAEPTVGSFYQTVERQLQQAYAEGVRFVNNLRLAVELHSLTKGGQPTGRVGAEADRPGQTCSHG